MRFEHEFIELGNLCNIKSGKRLPKGHTLTNNPTPYPYIRLVDINSGRISRQNIQFIDEETRSKIKRYIVEEGDVCLAIVGHTIGMVFFVEKKWDGCNLTENAARLTKLDNRFNSKFIYYYLNSTLGQHEIVSRKVGSAQGKLPLYNINKIPIPNLKLSEQNFIVTILDNLDEKIRLHEEINQTLEQMAIALFKSWFVDFEPVKAKIAILEAGGSQEDANSAAMTAISGKGIDLLGLFEKNHPEQYAELKATAELFPSSMQENELGEIPLGWTSENLGSMVEPKKGKNITRKTIESGDIPVVAGGLTPAYYHNKSNVTGPVITVSASGANAGFVNLYHCDIWASDCSYINKTQTQFVYTLYTFLKIKQKEITHMQQGAAQPHVYPKDLMRLKINVAQVELWKKLEKVLTNIYKQIGVYAAQNINLASIRDLLLPKLLSGEITLPEAERAVSEAENV